MSEFEYLAVIISIIFGISVTHILAGVIRSIYRGQIDETHFVLTAFFFLVMILNWWTGYSWQSQTIVEQNVVRCIGRSVGLRTCCHESE